ncbi:hypothetical protein GQ457_06G000820 [Hibiscus cannabinus]
MSLVCSSNRAIVDIDDKGLMVLTQGSCKAATSHHEVSFVSSNRAIVDIDDKGLMILTQGSCKAATSHHEVSFVRFIVFNNS